MRLFRRKAQQQGPPPGTLVYCEPVWASSLARWHIRRITETGLHTGGGADTKALCGLEVSWDIFPIATNPYALKSSCPECVAEYRPLLDEVGE